MLYIGFLHVAHNPEVVRFKSHSRNQTLALQATVCKVFSFLCILIFKVIFPPKPHKCLIFSRFPYDIQAHCQACSLLLCLWISVHGHRCLKLLPCSRVQVSLKRYIRLYPLQSSALHLYDGENEASHTEDCFA